MISVLLLVPCRNEAQVLERKLRNLAWCEWPVTDRTHHLVVIDDHSTDGTFELAQRLLAELFEPGESLRVSVVRSSARPGKSGAIARGLAERASEELVFLTDADVVCGQRALVRLARAFADRRLGMACGAQRFVTELPADGSCAAEPVSAAGLYDRITAGVRAFESWSGSLVSVHGQLIAWRAGIGVEPTPTMAADDLDLMLQVRGAGERIERVPEATFHELKTPAGPGREAQAIRRARAYVQFLGHPRIGALTRGGPFRSLQGWCYRALPTAMPWLLPAGVVAVGALLWWLAGPVALGLGALAMLALAASPIGRRLIDLVRVIAIAARRESEESMNDVWETARH